MSEIKSGKYEQSDGFYYYENNQLHREDGPAIVEKTLFGGRKIWYQYGKRHRMNGPAIEKPTGYKEWWLYGQKMTKKEYDNFLLKKQLMESLEKALDKKATQSRIKI